MKGIVTNQLALTLRKIHPKWHTPLSTCRNISKKLKGKEKIIESYCRRQKSFDFFKNYHDLPLEAFAAFTAEELCKLRYASVFCMHTTIDDLFENEPCFYMVDKLKISMLQWSHCDSTWNEVVDAYHLLQKFSFGDLPDGFDVRFDHATYCNECGYSRYSRTFLDGSFGFLLYYRGKHVLTIGFSIIAGHGILVQQVQLKNKRGNRCMYKLPHNRVAYAIDLFRKNFPGYDLFIVDGGDLVEKSISAYKRALVIAQQYEEFDDIARLSEMIRHAEGDKDRLAHIYADVGTYIRLQDAEVSSHGLRHYRIHCS